MAPLSVDPEAMFAAGSAVQAAGEGLAANLAVLTAGFSANTGHDLPGEVFGLGYQDAAGSLLNAAAAAINACRHCGARIQQGAVNYSNVEAASTLGGGGGGLQAPAEPVKMTAPGPPGTLGPGPPPPALWEVVQSFVDGLWPDGDVAGIHAAAARWRGFGAAANGMRDALSASKTLFDGQHIPEAGKIDEALSQIGDCMGKLGEQCGELARRLDHFANEVDQAQDHIRDLLHRLESLANPIHTAMLIFEGDAFDEIKKIAQDVNAVLHQLGRDARALEDGIKIVMQVGDGLVVKSEKYVRGALVQFLGERVGNPVATVFDTWANTNEGLLKGAVGMVEGLADLSPQWFLVDPQGAAATWSGLGKTMWKGSLANSFLHPKEAAETNLQMLKSLLHVEDWRRDRPGLGLGENIFDVGTLLVPGAGEAGAAADGAGAAARGAEAAGRAGEGAAGGLRGIESARGALAGISKTGGDLGKNLEGVTGDLPKIEAPPAGGTPVGLSSGKPPEAPVEAAPHPPMLRRVRPRARRPLRFANPGLEEVRTSRWLPLRVRVRTIQWGSPQQHQRMRVGFLTRSVSRRPLRRRRQRIRSAAPTIRCRYRSSQLRLRWRVAPTIRCRRRSSPRRLTRRVRAIPAKRYPRRRRLPLRLLHPWAVVPTNQERFPQVAPMIQWRCRPVAPMNLRPRPSVICGNRSHPRRQDQRR